ncbi:type I polyketide synthase [Salinispora fenicalii]|uniref:type I polyketide synthase n=1 Tax=Salinispora fenicalii TaxID=1137263 RepID=UPI0005343B11|nr:type I polyketide synthase [Salinispora fenicalii]
MSGEQAEHNVHAIREFLLSQVVDLLGVPRDSVDRSAPLHRYGLDSLKSMRLVNALAEFLGRPVPVTLPWDHPTLEDLSVALARGLQDEGHASVANTQHRAANAAAPEPLALVGIGCRLPGAADPAAFWRLLVNRNDAVRPVPQRRRDLLGGTEIDDASFRWGGFLDDVDLFDPLFFGISPREARVIDPQQRLVLELAWEALEDAGIAPGTLTGSDTGVFVGSSWSDYSALAHQAAPHLEIGPHVATGMHDSIIANRVSYALGLQGPSLAVDTACSSSLVAVHLACQSLWSGESDLALAGGVTLNLFGPHYLAMNEIGALSPDGRCKAFDARADGMVRGEGAALVVVTPLRLALERGLPVYCLIRGSAVNNDGLSNGLTAPNPGAQEALLRSAYQRAGLSPWLVDYVECHGTGTPLGDPIEAKALGAVLGRDREPGDELRIGSVKTNIGHLEPAAGIAGLAKVALAIRNGVLPASLHYSRPNPQVPFAEGSLRVQDATTTWQRRSTLRRAGVSAFGFGGTNCHLVAEELPQSEAALLLLAADSEQDLADQVAVLRASLADDQIDLATACRQALDTLGAGRFRLSAAARTTAELRAQLDAYASGQSWPGLSTGNDAVRRPRVAFLCSGTGSQWFGMCRQLLASMPAFRRSLVRAAERIEQVLGVSVLDRLFDDEPRARLDDMEVVQPMLFCIQVALADAWRSLGVEPDLVIGQSVGEFAAAHLAGALSLEDAALVAATHARLVQRSAVGQGDSLVVAAAPDVVAGELAADEGSLTLAGRLGPASTLVSGDAAAISALTDRLAAANIVSHRVRMGYAAHSPLMDPVLRPLRSEIDGIVARPAHLTMISTVTGKEVDGESLGPDYWLNNVRQESRLTAALDTMAAYDVDVVVELSPHPVLLKGVRESLDGERKRPTRCLASLQRGTDDAWSMLASLGDLHTAGQEVAAGPFLYAPRGRHAEPRVAIGPEVAQAAETPLSLLPITAHSAAALRDTCRGLSNHVERDPTLWVPDLAYTLATRRTPLSHRLALVVHGRDDLLDRLAQIAAGNPGPGTVEGTVAGGGARRIAFVFSGAGTHWAGMGRALMDQHAGFRASMHECDAVLRELVGWSVIEELSLPAEQSRLDEFDVQQPVLFTLQVSLARLWMELGVKPEVFVGHSLGEVAAVCVAGGLSLRDAARVVVARSDLMQHHAGQGAMTAVEAGPEEVAPFLVPYGGRVAIAAVNSPISSTVSGPSEEVRAVEAALSRAGISSRTLRIDRAAHGPAMDPLLAPLREALADIEPRVFQARLHSTALDGVIDPVVDADYWAQNLRNQVRFAPTVAALASTGVDTFIEISPHMALRVAIEEITQAQESPVLVIDSMRRGQDDNRVLLDAAASLFVRGVPLSLAALFSSSAQVVETPLVSWQRNPYWLDGVPDHPPHPPVVPAAVAVAAQPTRAPDESTTAPTAEIAEVAIVSEIAEVLDISVDTIAQDARLQDFGLDSMLAIRLSSKVNARFGCHVSVVEFLKNRTVGELTARIAALVGAGASTVGEEHARPRHVAIADELSDADAEELLDELAERGLLEPASPQAVAVQPREELRAVLENTRSFALAPAAHGQAAIWFMQQLSLDGAAYNLMFGARVFSSIDEDALRQAVAAVVERHPVLRTAFVEAGGRPYQLIKADPGYEFDTVDGTGLDDAALTDLFAEYGHRSFDLDNGPLLRLVLVNRGEADHGLLLVIHHVAADAASVDTVVRDLRVFYGEAQRGELLPQGPEKPYTEFVEWEREWLGSPAAETALRWWSDQLAQPPTNLDLPVLPTPDAAADQRSPIVRDGAVSYVGEDATFRWDATDARRLKDFAARAGVSVSTLVTAAFFATLGRVTGESDIILGTAVAQRGDTWRESAVGYYLNTVPVRARPRPDITFDALLGEVHNFALGMLEHMNYPLDLLISTLKPPREKGRTPLFDIAINWLSGNAFTYVNTLFHGIGGAAWPAGPLPLVPLPLRRHIAKFDLEITMADIADEVVGQVQFKSAVLERETVTTLLEYFHRLLMQAIDRPNVPLSDLVLDASGEQATS